MKLIITPAEFEYLENKSYRNHNYYKDKNGIEILEICHEDWHFYEYRLIEGDSWTFLGSSVYSISAKDEEVEIDFKQFYS